jgi:hypothetical protein
MQPLTHIILLVNQIFALIGLPIGCAGLIGLVWQQEIPSARLTTLAKAYGWTAAMFMVFGFLRWYTGEHGWMVLNFADAFIAGATVLAAMGLVWRDEPDVYEPEAIDAAQNSNHRVPVQPVVIDAAEG